MKKVHDSRIDVRWMLAGSLAITLTLVGTSVAGALTDGGSGASGGAKAQTVIDQNGNSVEFGGTKPPPLPPPSASGNAGPAQGSPAANDVQVHVVRNGKMYTVTIHGRRVQTTDAAGQTAERVEVSPDEVNAQLPPLPVCGPVPTVGCRPA